MHLSYTANMVAIAGLTGTVAALSHEHFHQSHQARAAAPIAKGCFSSSGGGMISQGSFTYQSSAHCSGICQGLNMPVMALSDTNECSCGELLPAASDAVSTSECSYHCTGYPEACGGPGVYTIWLTGTTVDVGSVSSGSDDPDSSSSSSTPSVAVAPTTQSTTVVQHTTVATTTAIAHAVTTKATTKSIVQQQTTTIMGSQETIIQTVGPTATPTLSSESNDGSSNSGSHNSTAHTVGIAVGVVCGILGLAALIAGAAFYARRRRRMKNAENGHARADSLNAFVASGGTLPGVVPRRLSSSDSRLDPRIMVETRRQSAGSVFADNQDYSRRILKVANPDDL